jgi:hypothetical protein
MFKASAMAIGIVVSTAMGVPAPDRAADKAAVEATFKEFAASYARSPSR